LNDFEAEAKQMASKSHWWTWLVVINVTKRHPSTSTRDQGGFVLAGADGRLGKRPSFHSCGSIKGKRKREKGGIS